MGKNKKTSQEVRKIVSNSLLVIVGSIILAIGTGLFLVPANIVAGGLSGIGIVLKKLFGLDVDITVAILDWFLFVVGIIFLGKRFSMQTLLGTIIYPAALVLIYRFFRDPIGLAPVSGDTNVAINEFHALLAGLFGGAFVGAGCALTYLGGGSTGGTDVITFIIRKYFGVKPTITGFCIDAIIIAGAMFTVGIIPSLIGILSAFISAMMVELIFIGGTTNYVAQIISVNKAQEINDFIQYTMGRGTTIFEVKGGFQGTPYKMIQVAFEKKEYVSVRDGIARIDPKAFVTFNRVSAINGEGFEAFPERDFKKSLGINEFLKKKK